MPRKYIHSIKGKYFLFVSELVIITALTTFAFISLWFFLFPETLSGLLETMSPKLQFLRLQIKHFVVSKKITPPVLSLLWALYCISQRDSSIFHRQLNLIVFQSEIISSLVFYPHIMSSVYSSFWLMSISKLNILVGVSLVIPLVQSGVSPLHSFSWLFPLHPLCSGLFPLPNFFSFSSTDNSLWPWKLFYKSINTYSTVSASCVLNKGAVITL